MYKNVPSNFICNNKEKRNSLNFTNRIRKFNIVNITELFTAVRMNEIHITIYKEKTDA